MNLFQNEQSEQAFRVWQQEHSACLTTNWVVSTEKANEMSYDRFCMERYTGRLSFTLHKNTP